MPIISSVLEKRLTFISCYGDGSGDELRIDFGFWVLVTPRTTLIGEQQCTSTRYPCMNEANSKVEPQSNSLGPHLCAS